MNNWECWKKDKTTIWESQVNGKKKLLPWKDRSKRWKENRTNLREKFKIVSKMWEGPNFNKRNLRINIKLWVLLKLDGKWREENTLTKLAICRIKCQERIINWQRWTRKLIGGKLKLRKKMTIDLVKRTNWEKRSKDLKTNLSEEKRESLNKLNKINSLEGD